MRIDPAVRWLIRRDMPEVLQIERGSFARPWDDEDFLQVLRQRNCIGMVAESEGQIVGFMVYELHKGRLAILNFAVDPQLRRCGIGRAMMTRLVDKLSQQRRKEILVDTREGNLDAQLFLRTCGFKAVRVVRGFYEDTGEDAYVLKYRLDGEFAPVNRIAGITTT